jgi:hypothetical protein
MSSKQSEQQDGGDESPLAALLGPASVRFAGTDWPEEPILHQAALARLPAVFRGGALSGLKELLAHHRGEVQIARGLHQMRIDHLLSANDRNQILAFYELEFTIFFPDIRPSVPGLAAWVGKLAKDVGAPGSLVRVGAFASTRSQGLVPHYDGTANIVLQLEGQKVLRVAPSTVAYPTHSYASGAPAQGNLRLELGDQEPPVAPEDMTAQTLSPGDALYLPPGYWHASSALDRESFSVSLVFDWPPLIDVVLEGLRSSLLQLSSWRRPAFRAWGTDHARARSTARVRSLLDELGRLCKAVSAEDCLGAFQALDAESRVKYFAPGSRFQKKRTAVIELHPEDEPNGSARFFLDQAQSRAVRVTGEPARAVAWIKEWGRATCPPRPTS